MIPAASHRRDRGRRRLAFTLIELLIVIAVISVLAGMILTVVVMVKDRAKLVSTTARLNAVLNALSTYAASEGSVAVSLQTRLDLGGAHTFNSVKVINNAIPTVAPGSAEPPPFRQWLYGGSWTKTDVTAANYSANTERRTLWQRLSDNVMDVMPLAGETWVQADYTTTWPTQWPETDWYVDPPGAIPPVLRFPWGKPGLRIDATLCDPAQPAGLAGSGGNILNETTTSAGRPFPADAVGRSAVAVDPLEQTANSWVTLGNAAGTIWQWSTISAAQTDYVTAVTARRSNGIPVIAVPEPVAMAAPTAFAGNAALPFDLGHCSPLRTIALLQAAGILAPGAVGEDAYRTDRKPRQPWNDAWGHPLVVVYAMYQPERYQRTFDNQNRRDLLMRGGHKSYQYNRSLYFAVGAPGAEVGNSPQTWTAAEDLTVLRDNWLWIRYICDAHEWDETAFTKPPWNGVRTGKKSLGNMSLKSMITAPIEVK